MMARMPYVVERRGLLFWQPTPEMRAKGFLPKPLGKDGPGARTEAARLYEAWKVEKARSSRPTEYPTGTFGAYYDRFRRLTKWAGMAPRTREDYERAWKHIDSWRTERGETLARTVLTKITTEDCEALFLHLSVTVSPSERYRTIKCLKILLADAVVRLRLAISSPAANLTNPQAKGRSQIWLGAEIEVLVRTATEQKFAGMALAVRIAWDSLFSPGDIWPLRRSHALKDGQGRYLRTERAKTGKVAYGALSAPTAAMLDLALDALPGEVDADVQIIRQRNGQPYRSKDTFGDDFRTVRNKAFPSDKRQFLDIRRSGNVEADAAGADKATMGELLANGMADNRFLEDTYTPATVTKAREVAVQRLDGRRKLAGEITRIRSKSIT